MSDEEFYSADEHEDDSALDGKDEGSSIETDQNKLKNNEQEPYLVNQQGHHQSSDKTVSYAQNIAGYLLCSGGPERSSPDENAALHQYMQASTSNNNLPSASSYKVSQGNSTAVTNNEGIGELESVFVTNLDVSAFVDLSDSDGFRYTSYRISITKSDGKIIHVLRRFSEISEAYLSMLQENKLSLKNQKELSNYNFPHKSLLNTFASHTLERRRVGFANFLKLVLGFIKKGDVGCVDQLATLLAVDPKLFEGTSKRANQAPPNSLASP